MNQTSWQISWHSLQYCFENALSIYLIRVRKLRDVREWRFCLFSVSESYRNNSNFPLYWFASIQFGLVSMPTLSACMQMKELISITIKLFDKFHREMKAGKIWGCGKGCWESNKMFRVRHTTLGKCVGDEGKDLIYASAIFSFLPLFEMFNKNFLINFLTISINLTSTKKYLERRTHKAYF
jgi:hypothetical protein